MALTGPRDRIAGMRGNVWNGTMPIRTAKRDSIQKTVFNWISYTWESSNTTQYIPLASDQAGPSYIYPQTSPTIEIETHSRIRAQNKRKENNLDTNLWHDQSKIANQQMEMNWSRLRHEFTLFVADGLLLLSLLCGLFASVVCDHSRSKWKRKRKIKQQ